jgi:gluconolactonase
MNKSLLRLKKWLVLSMVAPLLSSISLGAAAQQPIVPPNAKVEKIFDATVLTEGVAVAPDGMVYFSDITFSHKAKDDKGAIEAGHIWKYDPASGKTAIFRSPSGMSNGIKFDAHGNMIIAEGADYGGRRVIRTDMTTGKSYIIAAMFENRPLNSPNDINDRTRRAVFTSATRAIWAMSPSIKPLWRSIALIPTDHCIASSPMPANRMAFASRLIKKRFML